MRSSFLQKFVSGVALAFILLTLLPNPAQAAVPASAKTWSECYSGGGTEAECNAAFPAVNNNLATQGQQIRVNNGTASAADIEALNATRQQQAAAAGAQNAELKCNSVSSCLIVLMYYAGPLLASYIAYIGAYFFSLSIQLSLNSTAYALGFLTEGWGVVRDLANMAFIFILIYIAMTVMLQAETAGTIKTLAIVIVIALLVNFSFFFTRVAIDTGNILALQFYNAIPNNGTIPATAPGATPNRQATKDLSASIMGAIGVQSLLSTATFSQAQKATQGSAWGAVGLYSVIFVAMAAMFWMLFFAFLQVGIKFMLRIVALWLIIIASPLAFVARTMKQTQGYFTRWFDMLIQFSLYPAIFLFIYLIVAKFATTILQANTNGGKDFFGSMINSAASGDATTSTMGVIASVGIRLGFVLALLYVGLRVSDWIVKEGSSIATSATGKITGASIGAAALAGRNTFGRMGYMASQSKTLQNAGAKNAVGRSLLLGANRLGSATFDARNSKAASKTLGILGGKMDKAGKITPLDLGKPTNKGGFSGDKKATFDARVKELQKQAAMFSKGPTEAEKAAAFEEGKAKGTAVAQEQFKGKLADNEKAREALETRRSISNTNLEALRAKANTTDNAHTRAKTNLQLAANKIKALENMKKQDTPEMQAALDIHEDAQAKLIEAEKQQNAVKEDLAEVEKRAAQVAQDATTFEKNTQDLKNEIKEETAKKIKEFTPEVDNKKIFANYLSTPHGIQHINGVPKANLEAAKKIRQGKSKQDELMEKIKELQKEEGDKGGH